MYKYWAENVVFLLIKNKIVDIEERDIYVYGLEVLLLNMSNILSAFLISLFTETLWHFCMFLIVFVPLRVFAGGYHARSSESCFIITLAIYAGTVFIVKLFPLIYTNTVAVILLFVLLIPIVKLAPLEHRNNPLSRTEHRRNKLISVSIAAVDSVIFIMMRVLDVKAASSIMIFIAVISVLMLVSLTVKDFNNCY